jgi:hypothetical protein
LNLRIGGTFAYLIIPIINAYAVVPALVPVLRMRLNYGMR